MYVLAALGGVVLGIVVAYAVVYAYLKHMWGRL